MRIGLGLGIPGYRRRAPSAPPFSPADIPGLAVWLRADQGLYQDDAGTTPATSEDDPVGLWTDLSGNDNHVLQTSSGSRPVLKLGTLGGQNEVLFDATDDYLLGAPGFVAASTGDDKPFTVAVVCKVVTLDRVNTAWGLFNLSQGGGPRITRFHNANNAWRFRKRDDSGDGDSTVGTGVGSDLNPIFFVDRFGNGGPVRLRSIKNGLEVINQNVDVGESTFSDFVLGGMGGGGFAGGVAEVLAWSRALDDEETGALVNYLSSRYSIALETE